MPLLRWKTIVHLCASLILVWTAVDLLVPELCAAEEMTVAGDSSHESNESPVQPDSDCFCCSHTVSPMPCDAIFAVVTSASVEAIPMGDLALGVSPLLYHPPLQA